MGAARGRAGAEGLTKSHSHTLQHLDVVVNLEGVVEVEQVLGSAMAERVVSYAGSAVGRGGGRRKDAQGRDGLVAQTPSETETPRVFGVEFWARFGRFPAE